MCRSVKYFEGITMLKKLDVSGGFLNIEMDNLEADHIKVENIKKDEFVKDELDVLKREVRKCRPSNFEGMDDTLDDNDSRRGRGRPSKEIIK